MTFGLNALRGRHKLRGNAWGGAWDHINTQDFINYTVSKGYAIDSWEFGKNQTFEVSPSLTRFVSQLSLYSV